MKRTTRDGGCCVKYALLDSNEFYFVLRIRYVYAARLCFGKLLCKGFGKNGSRMDPNVPIATILWNSIVERSKEERWGRGEVLSSRQYGADTSVL